MEDWGDVDKVVLVLLAVDVLGYVQSSLSTVVAILRDWKRSTEVAPNVTVKSCLLIRLAGWVGIWIRDYGYCKGNTALVD